MIKYALLENTLVANANGCVAVVTTSGTKDLNDILDLMIAEGKRRQLSLKNMMSFFGQPHPR